MMPDDEGRFRRIIDGAVDFAIFAIDPGGIIRTWNTGAERMFQFTAEEAMGQPSGLIFTPEDHAQGEHEREITIAATEGRAEDDRWHVRRDNSRLWANGVLTRLQGDDGEIVGFVKVIQDKTDHRRMQEDLKRSEEQFARVFLGNPAAMVIERRDTSAFVLANEAFFRLIGYWRAETMGRSGSDMRLWHKPKQREEAFAKMDAEGHPVCVTIDIRAKSGEVQACAVALATTQLNGHDCVIMTVIERCE